MRRINSLRVGVVSSIRRVVEVIGPNNISFVGTGYAGSVYSTISTNSGQWYANETPIPGATGTSYVMAAEYEGSAITYRTGETISNSIKMFTPADISGITGWWDAAATSTLTLVGNQVSNWASRVGSASWSQATAGSRPTWSATGRNNLPAIVTSGAQRMSYVNNANVLPTGTNSSHTFIVGFNSASDAVFRAILNWASTSSGTARGFGRNTSLNVFFTGSNASTDNFSNVSWLNVDKIQSTAVTNSSSVMHIDGNATPFTRLVTYNTATNTNAAIFSDINSGSYWVGSAQDVINYNRPLTQTERQYVEGYIAAKWNLRSLLPVDHPFKTTMPVNLPVIFLQSGIGYFGSVFETTATGGQWYADETPIAGATGQTYTLSAENEGKVITYRNSTGMSNSLKYFVPSDAAGLTAWWDAASTSTLTLTGSQVDSWASRVGSATWNQTVSSNKPTWSATGRNSLPAVMTNGSPQRMSHTNTGALPTGTNPSYSFILGHLNSGGGGTFRAILNWASSTGGTGRYFGHNNSVNVTLTGTSTATDNFSTVSWANTDKIQAALITGTASSQYIDGNTTPVTKTATYNTTANNVATLFASTGGTQFWIGSAQDIIIYNQSLSNYDRQRIEGYLAGKWNLRTLLPSDHPYKSVTPL